MGIFGLGKKTTDLSQESLTELKSNEATPVAQDDSGANGKGTEAVANNVIVTFNANGGAGTQANVEGDSTKSSPLILTAPECTFTPPAGKEFKIWSKANNAEPANGTYAPGSELRFSGHNAVNLTLYAIWKDAPAKQPDNQTPNKGDNNNMATTKKKIVKFNANGGTGTMADVEVDLTSGNAKWQVIASTFTAPDGKEFKTWAENADGTKNPRAVGSEIDFGNEGEYTLYAIWQDKATTNPDQGQGGGSTTKPDQGTQTPADKVEVPNKSSIVVEPNFIELQSGKVSDTVYITTDDTDGDLEVAVEPADVVSYDKVNRKFKALKGGTATATFTAKSDGKTDAVAKVFIQVKDPLIYVVVKPFQRLSDEGYGVNYNVGEELDISNNSTGFERFLIEGGYAVPKK